MSVKVRAYNDIHRFDAGLITVVQVATTQVLAAQFI